MIRLVQIMYFLKNYYFIMLVMIIQIKEIFAERKKYEQLYDDLVKLLGIRKVSNKLIDRIMYSRDYWPIALHWFMRGVVPAIPDIVVWPESTEDVVKVVKYAYEKEIPIVAYGGGSGVLGGAMPEKGGIVIDLKRMRRIKIYPRDLLVEVESGTYGMILENYLNKHGFTLGHIPQSLYTSTVGGWVSTKAIGQFSTKYGGIEDMVAGIEVVVPPGEVVVLKPHPRTSTGPDLRHLFIGSEGIFGIITRVFLRIWRYPEKRVFLSYATDTIEEALERVRTIVQSGVKPAVVRIFDKIETKKWFYWIKQAKNKVATIFVIEGNSKIVDAEAEIVKEAFKGTIFLGEKPVKHWLKYRFVVKEVSEFAPLGFVFDTIEVAINWSNATKLYYEVIKAMRNVEGTLLASAHASHFYPQGVCFYFTFGGIPPKGMTKFGYYAKVWEAAMKTTLKLGGTISHHHGIGRMRAPWLPLELGKMGYEILRKVKHAIDEKRIMNPGNLGV